MQELLSMQAFTSKLLSQGEGAVAFLERRSIPRSASILEFLDMDCAFIRFGVLFSIDGRRCDPHEKLKTKYTETGF